MNKTPTRVKLEAANYSVLNSTPSNNLFFVQSPHSKENTLVNSSPRENVGVSPGESRRGRPRAEILNTLILEGSSSPSSIKCTYCGRVFPREKSLQAHLRTHTGERPYACDYPRCTRKFTQSGQLKTHQRLHTGEKPFICMGEKCERRFTHANRHCPEHPEAVLKRFTASSTVGDKFGDDDHSTAVQKWLKNNRSLSPENNLSTPRKSMKFDYYYNEDTENINSYNIKDFPQKFSDGIDSESSRSSSKTSCDLESYRDFTLPSTSHKSMKMQVSMSQKPSTEHIELPKKRWLREAVQDQQRWDSSQELARPLNWDEVNLIEYENQRRPTVLMRVQDRGETKEVSRADMQTAIALVELKNGGPISYRQY